MVRTNSNNNYNYYYNHHYYINSHLTEETARVYYKHQTFDAVYGNIRLFWELHKILTERRADNTCIRHCALKVRHTLYYICDS
jgi:aminoglycoside phosphotransferase family enzyme